MSFASPTLLVALLAVPGLLAWYIVTEQARDARRLALARDGLVEVATARPRRWRRHLTFAVMTLAIGVLALAAARPQIDLSWPARRGTVILAFDVSSSMLADDVEPNRIDAAKAAATEFVMQQPDTVKVGVVAFGDGAVATQPPTLVRADVVAAIDRLSTAGGTSLGQGLFSSLSAIAGEPIELSDAALAGDLDGVDIGYFGSSAVVVLSDGENTAGPEPQIIAQLASIAGVTVHTIGIGSPDGAVIDVDGFRVATSLDEELLTDVAELTDGTYRAAAEAESLAQIYESIDLELTSERLPREATGVFTLAGLCLLALGALLALVWQGRVA